MRLYCAIFLIFILFACNKVDKSISLDCNDETKVIAIAEREWLKVYGKSIYETRPFIAEKVNDSIWKVSGTLNSVTYINNKMVLTSGGVPYIEINSKNCAVTNITHGK
ncbi:hypothetical protein IX39_20440 [Chryseobacterium formosense]|uniref:NTF2 fold domain-containing protein n=1 Tax=Chryseobacterium formosense TaxID=236814 RepID=A0A085YYV0_9FLAO|nr:NTF2 fold immunity protein [Chryseobacterium formosense]KFE97363.1 hypothetical protein IX39_20440 [Chryseobacterium formosense]SFT91537.1 NTF2 fold immunity protein [Chryseobacterium formosense]